MERLVKETTIRGERGPQRVITHGYDTKINGLDVIRTIDRDIEEYTLVHAKSGLGMAVYFSSLVRAERFANKHLNNFDFTQDREHLLMDGKLCDCVRNAKNKEGI